MPRQARFDGPGTLHRVILRGRERGAIVQDEVDREVFVPHSHVVRGCRLLAMRIWSSLVSKSSAAA